MIKDISGIILTPGNYGKDCLGNGEHFDKCGKLIDCCCDECDYMICCLDESNCNVCCDNNCTRKNMNK